MQTILSLTLIVEPDRQRFMRFAINAVQALEGNAFAAVMALNRLLPRIREDGAAGPLDIRILLEGARLAIAWGDQREELSLLEETPTADKVTKLSAGLREASEAADMELLMRRNQQIKTDLEAAKERAAAEMAQMETALEKKKSELQDSLRLAETDCLTGLLNRGAYDSRLREAFHRCKRQGQLLSLILLDLDRFKEINDTHGHQYGDEYLKKTADAMRAAVREHVDHLCRFGGDEFAIIMFADIAIAERVANKLLASMNGMVSIGITRLQENDTIESMVKRADGALYQAKRRGRGQYVTDVRDGSTGESSTTPRRKISGEK